MMFNHKINRHIHTIVKLFSDNSYSNIGSIAVDTEIYTSRNCEELSEILAKFTKDRKNGS